MIAGAILDLNWTRVNAAGNKVVGWPLGNAKGGKWMYERVAEDAKEYAAAGFTAVLFPPSSLGAAGVFSDGYDVKDHYTLDGTAFGTSEMLIAAVKAVHDAGMQAGCDLVLHQMDGYPKQEYATARWPKTPKCFAKVAGQPSYPGNVEPDSVPDPSGGYPDGDLCAYDQPDRYMWNNAITWARWLKNTVGFDFCRIDEAKDLHAPFVKALLESTAWKNSFAIGEYSDGANYALGGYVNYWMGGRVSVLDFGFKYNVGDICNNAGRSWMGALAQIGYCSVDAAHAVTFLESHDSDTSPGQQVIWNKALGFGILGAFPGYPMVYYRDWSTDENCYGLKAVINNALWIHRHLAQGDFVVRHEDYQTFACERMGYENVPGCVCGFNNDAYNEYTIWVQTRYAAGTRLHEYSGNGGYSNDRWVDERGGITITLPKNDNGRSYLIYGLYL